MKIALLGFGTVGKAVYDIIDGKKGELFHHSSVEIKYILVRNIENKGIDKRILITDFSKIIEDDDIELVIEMMGSKISYSCIKSSLEKGKHVITANKEVIALHFKELYSIAQKNKAKIFFEAAVGGGILNVSALISNAQVCDIKQVEGILNGTTNFILSSMHQEKISFLEALRIAQEKGFAESDPKSDLEGIDMIRKITILSQLAYHGEIDMSKIYHFGIENVSKDFIEAVELLGYRVKFMAFSSLKGQEVSICVEPVIVSEKTLISHVNYENNIIKYLGVSCGEQMMFGQGAGFVTANAIVSDVERLLNNYNYPFYGEQKLSVVGKKNIKAAYFIEPLSFIDEQLIDKKIGKYYLTKIISGHIFEKILPNIKFYARLL